MVYKLLADLLKSRLSVRMSDTIEKIHKNTWYRKRLVEEACSVCEGHGVIYVERKDAVDGKFPGLIYKNCSVCVGQTTAVVGQSQPVTVSGFSMNVRTDGGKISMKVAKFLIDGNWVDSDTVFTKSEYAEEKK